MSAAQQVVDRLSGAINRPERAALEVEHHFGWCQIGTALAPAAEMRKQRRELQGRTGLGHAGQPAARHRIGEHGLDIRTMFNGQLVQDGHAIFLSVHRNHAHLVQDHIKIQLIPDRKRAIVHVPLRLFGTRDATAGTRFKYATSETVALTAVAAALPATMPLTPSVATKMLPCSAWHSSRKRAATASGSASVTNL